MLLLTDKGTCYLKVNELSRPSFDLFFKFFTFFGDGLLFLGITFLLLFKRIQYFFLFLMTYLSSGLMAQLLKKVIFRSAERPTKYFEELTNLHLVEGIDIHQYQSFPSGHTATAFALFLLLSILINNKWLSVLFFMMALLVGISRVYLSQHFLEDVIAGAVIGVVLTILCHKFVSNNSWFNKNSWMHLSLQQVIKRNDKA